MRVGFGRRVLREGSVVSVVASLLPPSFTHRIDTA
jgi:hypothetical protein